MPNVLNPGFEVDLANWTKSDANASTTWTRDTTITNAGSAGSSKLVNTAAGEDDFINNFADNSAQGFQPGMLVTVTAALNVTAFTAAATGNRGLFVVSKPSTQFTPNDPITAVTAGWVTKTVSLNLGSGDVGIEVRLYAPQATVYWDDVEVQWSSSAEARVDFEPVRFGPF